MTVYEMTQRLIFAGRARCPDCEGVGEFPDGDNEPTECEWCHGEFRKDGYSTIDRGEFVEWRRIHKRRS